MKKGSQTASFHLRCIAFPRGALPTSKAGYKVQNSSLRVFKEEIGNEKTLQSDGNYIFSLTTVYHGNLQKTSADPCQNVAFL